MAGMRVTVGAVPKVPGPHPTPVLPLVPQEFRFGSGVGLGLQPFSRLGICWSILGVIGPCSLAMNVRTKSSGVGVNGDGDVGAVTEQVRTERSWKKAPAAASVTRRRSTRIEGTKVAQKKCRRPQPEKSSASRPSRTESLRGCLPCGHATTEGANCGL